MGNLYKMGTIANSEDLDEYTVAFHRGLHRLLRYMGDSPVIQQFCGKSAPKSC